MKTRGSFKRIVAFLLAFVMVMGTGITAFADDGITGGGGSSNDRISAYINLAANKATTDMDVNNMSFTKDQLRFLGVYASNYYVPFSTEFGSAAGEDTDKSMESLKQALQTGLMFNDANAQVFSENIVGLARSSVQKLSFAFSKEYQKDYIEPTTYTIEANYYNFLTSMMGASNHIASMMEDGKFKEEFDSLEYGYWGYKKDGKFVPVFDCALHPDRKGRTSSQVAFSKCLEAVPIDKGYGWNVWDLTKEDVDGDEITRDMSADDMLDLSVLGMEMAVDCFGDIIIYGKQHQIVAVPGCVNPYTWRAVSSSGEDLLKTGEAYQIVNIMSMAAADKGNNQEDSLYKNINVSSMNTQNGSSSASGAMAQTRMEYRLFSSDSNFYKKYQFLKGSGTKTKDAEKLWNALKYVLGYADNVAGSDSWTLDFRSDGVYAIATYKVWAETKTSKLEKNYKYSNASKHEKLEDAFDTIAARIAPSNIMGTSAYPGTKRADVIGQIAKAVKKAKKELVGDSHQETSTDTGATNTLLKDMYAKFDKLSGKLSDVGSHLKVYRGTTETDLDQNFGFWSSSAWLDNFIKAIKKFAELHPNDKSYQNTGYNEGNDGNWGKDEVRLWTDATFADTSVYAMDAMVMIDSLGTYNFSDSGGAIDYNTFPTANYVNEDGTTANGSNNISWSYGSKNTFGAGYNDIKNGTIEINTEIDEAAVVSIYSSYLFASLYDSSSPESRKKTIGKLGYRLADDNLPTIPNEPLHISEASKTDLMLTSIRDWLYYLLHPTDGFNYVRELITNKVNAFLVGWHNDMTGTYGTGATTGTTLYRSQTGYVTSPDLSEIEWTSSLITFYNECIPFLIVIMIVTMLFAYITGILSLQRSIFGVAIFAVFLLMPVNLINGVVGFSNRVSQNLYGERFTYWALVQQESYSTVIDSSSNGDSYQNYLKTLYSQNRKVSTSSGFTPYSNQGGESIVLKWQAPKKMASLVSSGDSFENLTNGGKDLLNKMIGKAYTGEGYTTNEDSVYMYRSYLDIANFSRYIYRGIKNDIKPSKRSLDNSMISNFDEDLKLQLANLQTNFETDISKGYTNKNNNSSSLSDTIRVTVPLSSGIINSAFTQEGTIGSLSMDDRVGVNQNLFNFSIPLFNVKDLTFNEILLQNLDNNNSQAKADLEADLALVTPEDMVGLAAYGLYSENPFYYFSWCLYDEGLSPEASATGGYKNLLLGTDNAGYFYNTVGNGDLKDFIDMKSLFTYVIPYLRQCNQIVREWDDVYGIFTYDGVPTDEGHWEDEAIVNNPEMKQKYWHNLNVARLYSLYCPWVDIMYDCSYAKSERLTVMGEKHMVTDPLDPASYPAERPMIFSESEMTDYGLSRGDLTKAEKLILDCNKGMQERMYELLNYYTFNDVTLNTAAAMNCAFEFNNTFSENGLFASNHNIYPQSFELSDFSYDAFLRFILSNTTGEDITNQGDFYNNIVQNSSMTTVLIMLILDVISIYLLPAFKLFFIIGIFLSSILIIVVTAFRIDPEQKFIKRITAGLIMPMLKFLAISVGFSYIISLFMGTASNMVTETKQISIKMGDPVVVMFAMIAINIVALILYFKVIKTVVQDIKQNARNAGNFMTGVVGGVVGMVAGAVTAGAVGKGSSGSGGAGYGSGGVSEEGTGVSSERARRRSAKEGTEDAEDRRMYEEESTRRNDASRNPFKQSEDKKKYDKESAEKRKEDLNRKTKKGMDKMDNGSSEEHTRRPFSNNTVKDVGDNKRNRNK